MIEHIIWGLFAFALFYSYTKYINLEKLVKVSLITSADLMSSKYTPSIMGTIVVHLSSDPSRRKRFQTPANLAKNPQN
jgi:hypothetical protein